MTDAAARPPKKAAPAVNLPEFLEQELVPLLEKELKAAGCLDLKLTLVPNQLTAQWDRGAGDYTFTLYFEDGTLEGRKNLAYKRGKRGEVLQTFMPPERGFTKPDSASMVAILLQKFSTTLSWIQVAEAKV